MLLSNNPSSGDINLSNLSCFMLWLRNKKINFLIDTLNLRPNNTIMSPPPPPHPPLKVGGYIVFGADPVGVGVHFHFNALASEPVDGF